jgi:hypothetical protein
VDISDPRHPVLMRGRVRIDWCSDALACVDGIMYLVNDEGLYIHDFAAADDPRLLAFLPLPTWCVDVVVTGARAYVSRLAEGVGVPDLDVVDISDREAPRVVGTFPGLGGMRLRASGDRLYTQGEVVTIVGLADPDHPVILGTWDPSASCHAVTDFSIEGELAFAVCAGEYSGDVMPEHSLLVFDLADAVNPRLLGTWTRRSWAAFESIAVAGSLALVGDHDGGLVAVDVSDPSAPALLGGPVQSARATGIVIRDGLAYVGSAWPRLDVIDVAQPVTLRVPERLPTSGPVADIAAVADPHLCLMLAGGELSVVDHGTAGAAAVVTTFVLPGEPQRIVVADGLALVACGDGGLFAFDVSQPRTPQPLGAVPGVAAAVDLAVAGSRVLALADGGPVHVVDPAAPDGPAVIGSWTPDIAACRLAVADGIAWLGSWSQLQTVNVSDPLVPVPLWVTDVWWGDCASRLAARDGVLFAAHPYGFAAMADNGAGGDMLYSIHSEGTALALDGDVAYAISVPGGIEVLDLAAPGGPALAGSVQGPVEGVSRPSCAAVCGDHVIVGFAEGGLLVSPRHCAASVGVEVPEFTASFDGGTVRLRWTTNTAATSLSFRVVAHTTAGDRVLDGRALGEGRFEAHDDAAPSPGAVVAYVLEREDSPGAWIALATTEFMVPPLVGSPRLVGCAPNPFNPSTRVNFTLPAAAHATVTVHDAAGRQVAVLADRAFEAGPQSLVWDGRDTSTRAAASGMYLVRLRVGAAVDQRKVLLVR